jgi:hypothetical protein
MVNEDVVRTELEAWEPNNVAAEDAATLAEYANDLTHTNENLIRIRLYAIEREQSLGSNDLNVVWTLLGLDRTPPTWVPTP